MKNLPNIKLGDTVHVKLTNIVCQAKIVKVNPKTVWARLPLAQGKKLVKVTKNRIIA